MSPRFIPLLLACSVSLAGEWQHEDLRRFPAAEAKQGVAVDEQHFYAITNTAIGKYRKDTGERVTAWESSDGKLKHLNAGAVLDGKLYCAHSNFPDRPEQSSVEIWDVATLKHIDQHRFENPPGSLTWVDRRGDDWFACFAHYKKSSDPALSRVVKFDANWKPLATYTFPAKLIEHFGSNSSSGGSFGPGGHLFVTGHDAKELYVLDVPDKEGELIWRDSVTISAAGQAFAWDRKEAGVLYSVQRKTKEVLVSRIAAEASADFETLFDGRTFTGWEQKGNWTIEDGAFYRAKGGGQLTYTVKKVPDDFELRFEWKVSKGCNSGIYYRPGQYEYQILDNANSHYAVNPRQSAASLYFCMAPSKDASKPFGEWNEGRVVCKGSVIQHWLNGEKVIDFDYMDPKWKEEVELLRLRGADLASRNGKLWLQDHGAPVWFRNIRLRTIPPDEKLVRSEFTPMPMSPEALESQRVRVEQLRKGKQKK